MAPRHKNIREKPAVRVFQSPIGRLGVVVSDRGVHEILWPREIEDEKTIERYCVLDESNEHPIANRAIAELEEYFSGARTHFDVPLILNGTPFQVSAWNVLRDIPYGQTLSYEEQAIRLGGKAKVRAVGRANGQNRIPILIPCHRVIGKNGSLTGFGGGLAVKAFLLNLESGRASPT
jgi:methylated-DNA-[protein]-cysteine S-methyltransferase